MKGVTCAGREDTDGQGVDDLLFCCILGPLRVHAGGREMTIGGGVERQILNVLAAHLGRPVTDDALLDVVYPAGGRTSSMKALRTAVWRLRRSLGGWADAIRSDRGAYELDLRYCRVDAAVFDRRRGEGKALLERGESEAAADELAAALAMWRGPALADWSEHPLAVPLAVRLEELRLGAVEDHAAALLASGRPEQAQERLEGFVADHPLREHAWALLIDCAAARHRTSDAWRAYDTCRQRLADAGLEPGLGLRQAVDRLTLGATRSRASSAGTNALPSTLDLYRRRPLIGRAAELRLLTDLVDRSSDGQLRVAVISGEPGAGKTHLAAAVADAARAHRPVWLVAGDPYLNLAYRPVMDLVRDLLAGLDASRRHAHLAGPVGWLTDVEGNAGVAAVDGDRARYLIFEAVADLVADAVAPAGGLIVVDDAQWIPASSLMLLRHLVTSRPALPLVVLLVHRAGARLSPEQREPFADLRRMTTAQAIRLCGLGPDDVAALLGVVTGSETTTDAAQRIHEMTGGNPLYVRALAEHAVRSGYPVGTASPDLDPDGGIAAAIDVHLTALDPGMTRLLEVASVIGRRFDRRILTAVVAQTDRTVDPAAVSGLLADAASCGLLGADATNEGVHVFVHELIRHALYRRLAANERSRLHLEVARAMSRLVDVSAQRLDDVAHHFERAWPACPASESCLALEQAGRHAAHQLDFAQARKFFEAGLTLLAAEGPAAEPHQELRLRILLGRGHAYGGDGPRAREILAAAWTTARRLGDEDQAADAAIHHAETVGSDNAEDVVVASRAMVDDVVDRGDVVDAQLHARAVLQLRRLDPDRGRRQAARATTSARAAGDRERLAALLNDEWWLRGGDEQLAVADELIDIGVARGDARVEGHGRLKRWISLIHLGRGRYDDPVASVIDELVDAAHAPDLRWSWTAWRANVAMATGRLSDARRFANQTLSIADLEVRPHSIARPRVVVAYQLQMDYLCRVMGEPGPPLAAIVSQPWMWRTVNLHAFGALGRHSRTELHRMREALAAHRGSMTLDWVFHATTLGYLSTLAGDRAGVRAARASLAPLHGRYILSLGLAHGAVDQQLGWLDMHAGHLDDAVRWLTRGVEVNRAVGSSWHEARATYNLAAALWLRDGEGDRWRAEELVGKVLGGPMTAGMVDLTVGGWPPKGPPRAAYEPAGASRR